MVQDDSFEVYSPLSEDESFRIKSKNTAPPRSRAKPKEPKEENSKMESSEGQKIAYKQRKDVIFKKILRGCKKYYLQEFSLFSQKKSKKEIASMSKT